MAEVRKPKIFVFVNGPAGFGQDVIGSSIAEDGSVLPASHISSNASWCRIDMGADGHSTRKHEIYAAHYPDGFDVEWVQDVRAHTVLSKIIDDLNAKHDAEDKDVA